ncbi:unnamed protein product [Orchesella dallaii]|uniref:Protein quiver n=1 Tax=Orchesella dallaii TaxID=48710 RepID=A0ABP1S690_9HEXA
MAITRTVFQILFLTLSLVNLSTAATYSDLEALASKTSLKCYVCNTKVGGCAGLPEFEKSCSDYFKTVYGDPPTSTSLDLKNFPEALSERVGSGVTSDKLGWNHGGFPGLYTMPPGMPVTGTGPIDSYRTSSLNHLHADGKLDEGFVTCRVLKITVGDQQNGGVKQQIPLTTPRIIRTCSFLKKSDVANLNQYGCKMLKFKTHLVDVCYCDGDKCNGSSYMRVSYWMIAASLLLIMAQFGMH